MRCNNGKIRVCQENEGNKFRIYKYVPEGWVKEFALGVPVAKEEGNVMNYEILFFFKFFIMRFLEKNSSYLGRAVF